ncbi:MAG TPA: DUF2993 domain-containing protein [Solirubrobacteraceae bacterium]|jgi:hypothetical protein
MFLLFPIFRRLLYLAIFVAILAVAGELLARKLIGDAVSHAVAARIGVSPKVGFGSTPLVIQIIHGSLGDVTVKAADAHLDGLGPLALDGTLRDVHLRSLTSLQGAIGSLQVRAGVPPSTVRGMLATPACERSLPSSVQAGLSTAARVAIFPGRVDLLPPHGRAAEVRLRPYASNDAVRFAIIAIELGGAEVPPAQLRADSAGANCSRALSNLPFGVGLVSAQALDGTLELSFSGRDASFSAIG